LAPPSRRRVGVLVGLTALLVASLSAPAIAEPIDDKRAEAARIAQQLADQNRRISVLDEQYNQAQLRAGDTQAALAKADRDLHSAEARLAQAKDRLSANAVDAYVHGGTTTVIDQLIASSAVTWQCASCTARLRLLTSARQSTACMRPQPTSEPARPNWRPPGHRTSRLSIRLLRLVTPRLLS
jgi:hypothetical protein